MNQREKLLAGGVVLLLAGWGASGLWQRYQSAVDGRSDALLDIRTQVERAKLEAHIARSAAKDLERYQELSLPSDRNVAQSEYRDWLIDRLEGAGLAMDDVKAIGASGRQGDAFESLTFTAVASGTLESLTKFLDGFHRSGQLHKITALKLKPTPEGTELDINLTIQALIVPGVTRRAELATGDAERLTLADTDAYVKSIVGRNIFERYSPPPPPTPPRPAVVRSPGPPPPPKFDDARHAYVTGIVSGGEGLQAWITVRTTGKVLRLKAGEKFSVGQMTGAVESVTSTELVVLCGEDRVRLKLGQPLRGEQDDKVGTL